MNHRVLIFNKIFHNRARLLNKKFLKKPVSMITW